MDFMEGKPEEGLAAVREQKTRVFESSKLQLMKKVIVRMANNTLQLNFHPKLSVLAKTKPLNVQVTLAVHMSGKPRQ